MSITEIVRTKSKSFGGKRKLGKLMLRVEVEGFG
jgi:hypothetical protein